jgi:hypothetical protein
MILVINSLIRFARFGDREARKMGWAGSTEPAHATLLWLKQLTRFQRFKHSVKQHIRNEIIHV